MTRPPSDPSLLDRLRAAFRAAQHAVVVTGLFFLYLAGFAMVRAWMGLFQRERLRSASAPRWLPATDPTFDLESSLRQS